ncbi:unnamed protein product [Urochloa decumbens]|uniref:TRAP transporter small permease subunit n=1 Tax=Urochloa decumbens TaxID=240449 RepID=A0ABC8W4M9_9POAL
MASMDNSATAKLMQRPPSPQAAELPVPPPEDSGGRLLGKLSRRTRLLAVAAFLLVLDYFQVILKNLDETIDEPGAPLPWRLLAAGGVVLAYAALIWFLRRLERRRLPDDDHDARWEKGMKIAAHILDYPIFFVLGFYLAAMTPLALFIFVWVGSRDHVYLGIEVHEEESEKKQCEA